MVIWIGPNLHFVQYRLRGGTVMNNVATVASRKFENGERRGLRRPGRARRSVLAHHAARAGDARLRRQGQELGAARPRAAPGLDARQGRAARRRRAPDAAVPRSRRVHGDRGRGGALRHARRSAGERTIAARRCRPTSSERYLRTARVTITSRIFGDIIHADGGSRDLRNHLLAQRTPETFWEIDWLYRGIEA